MSLAEGGTRKACADRLVERLARDPPLAPGEAREDVTTREAPAAFRSTISE